MTLTVAAFTIIDRNARAAHLRDPGAPSLDSVEQRRMQLWTVAFVVMAALAVGMAFLSSAVAALADGTVAIPKAARIGIVPLVAGLALYVVEKERALRRLTRALVGGPAAPSETVTTRDPLTGLLERSVFVERLERALATASTQPLAVLVVDLDRLRQVTARYGPSVGDHLLQEVARRLAKTTRATDCIARLGAQEFGVLVDAGGAPAAAAELARRVVTGVREPVTAGGHQLVPTCSVGVVVRTTGGRDLPEDVLRDAGLACNLARVKGPNHWELFDQRSRDDG